jgi:hypothetical protein
MGSSQRESLRSQSRGACDGAPTLAHGPKEIHQNSGFPRSVSDRRMPSHLATPALGEGVANTGPGVEPRPAKYRNCSIRTELDWHACCGQRVVNQTRSVARILTHPSNIARQTTNRPGRSSNLWHESWLQSPHRTRFRRPGGRALPRTVAAGTATAPIRRRTGSRAHRLRRRGDTAHGMPVPTARSRVNLPTRSLPLVWIDAMDLLTQIETATAAWERGCRRCGICRKGRPQCVHRP